MERTAAVSPQTELGLGALRALARRPQDWDATELADALDARADRLVEVVGRLVAAGWLHAMRRSGRLTYRYADPRPIPTLGEVITAIDGAGAADDCALGLGPCGGLTGGPVCGAHRGWLRQLGGSALLALPLLPTQAARTRLPDPWHGGAERDEDRAATTVTGPDAADPVVAGPAWGPDPPDPSSGAVTPTGVGAVGPVRRDGAVGAEPMISRRALLRGALAAGAAAALDACGGSSPRAWLGPAPLGRPAAVAAPVARPAPPPAASPFVAPPVAQRRTDHPVLLENVRPGTAGWWAGADGIPAAEGYLSAASLAPGERATLHLASEAGTLDVDWYRLGWYGGAGGRLLHRERLPAAPATMPTGPSSLGCIEAGWPPASELEIDARWTSGMHLAVLRAGWGDAGYIPFVVRPPANASSTDRAPVLVVNAATTWQAYNCWGGKSLYAYNSSGVSMPWGSQQAAQVSFDRPHVLDQGAGLLFYWEIQFIRWLERHGRDVEYAADVDLVLHPEVFAGRRLVVFQGHHEYWSRGMRDALEGLIEAGTHVLFLSANEVYWQVRLDDSPLGPARRVTCYKQAAPDPMARSDPQLTTTLWRAAPVRAPEAAVVGQMYAHVVTQPADWRVVNARHWLYANTGLRNGDALVNLVGQEYDTYNPTLAPPGTILLACSPVVPDHVDPDTPPFQTATLYVAPSGATVFAAGTFQWSWALDDFGRRTWAGIRTPVDRRVGIMTANLLNRLGDGVA